jgi:hypothetical protein
MLLLRAAVAVLAVTTQLACESATSIRNPAAADAATATDGKDWSGDAGVATPYVCPASLDPRWLPVIDPAMDFSDCLDPNWLTCLVSQKNAWVVYRQTCGGVVTYYLGIGGDAYNLLYDRCGTMVCAPDGGFSGRGDGLCPDYVEHVDSSERIWREPQW